jgi:hypothetical protein
LGLIVGIPEIGEPTRPRAKNCGRIQSNPPFGPEYQLAIASVETPEPSV